MVYPNQGVCAVIGVEKKDIAGQKLELVRMEREEDGAAVLVPKGKVPTIGLRRVASGEQMEGVFHYLAAQFDDPELDWKVRHRDNADRLIAGGVLGVAEVVKGLHSLSRIRPLPTKEREQYDNARHLLVHEVAVSLGVPPALAEDYIDYALMPPAGREVRPEAAAEAGAAPLAPEEAPRSVAEEEDGAISGSATSGWAIARPAGRARGRRARGRGPRRRRARRGRGRRRGLPADRGRARRGGRAGGPRRRAEDEDEARRRRVAPVAPAREAGAAQEGRKKPPRRRATAGRAEKSPRSPPPAREAGRRKAEKPVGARAPEARDEGGK